MNLEKKGFKRVKHLIFSKWNLDIGRRRFISIAQLGTPDEIVSIHERDGEKVDFVILHNYDYDGYLTEKKLNYLIEFFREKNK